MVVVATSGGGSKAATWTAHVLGMLREDPALGKRFAESITLVSSVSGGSVGALYSLDQYKAPDMPLSKATGQASQSGLNAIAWGMVYPDLLRLIIPFNWLVDNTNDRGMSIERALQTQLAHESADQPDTLLQWSQTIEQQWRPIQVFNTTIAESGQRLLLSPIAIESPFHTSPFAQAVNFVTLYSKCDLALATAARLSATFPYVTPMARPLSSETCVQAGEPRYHLADGGYFDNFGIMTVLEYLSSLNPQRYRDQFKRHKIILIQIRAAPIEGASARGASTDGLAYANVGPLLASLQVQQVTQIGRNDLELELLRQQWAREGIEIESVVFELHKNVVLSWHLTDGDIQDIVSDFQGTGNQGSLERLKQIWQNN
ncbi:MAG: hypothetical protein HC853_06040 [Anaerolineae bacterium]|nr:hypothetical protein [Anaerolineae bacterium]